MRLLPWTGEGGQPAYLSTQGNDSYLSRLADLLETRQLTMAKDLQAHVDTVMNSDKPSEAELRGMVEQLSLSLRNTRRVAESRGHRLPTPDEGTKSLAANADARSETTGGRCVEPVGILPPIGAERHALVVRRWRNEPECVGGARQLLRLYLEAWGMSSLADTSTLVLSELFGNAVRHAHGCEDSLIETRFEPLPDGTLRIEVHDSDENKPERRDASADAEAGRGLALVEALTGGHWGVCDRAGIGKSVWALCRA